MNMPAELPTPIDLCLHYPEQTGTNQLEHYCDIVLRLFDASCVVLRFTQDNQTFICYSADTKHSYIDWFLAQARPELLSITPFFIPQYHTIGLPAGPTATLHMVREGSARLSTEQHEALFWLASSIADYLTEHSFVTQQLDPVFRYSQRLSVGSAEQVLITLNDDEEFQLRDDNGQSFLPLLCDPQLVGIQQQLRQALLHGRSMSFRVYTTAPQLFRFLCTPMACDKLLLTSHDLSPVHQLKEQQRRQAFLRGMFDCGLAAMVGLNANYQVAYSNQLAREALWLPQDCKLQQQAVTANYLRFFSVANDDEVALEPFQFVDPEATCRQGCHVRIQYPDGQSRIYAFWWVNRHDINEPEVAWYVLFFDVTEQYQLQQALGEMQHHVESLLQFSPVVIYQSFREINRGFIYISRNVETMLGYSQLDLMQQQQSFFDKIHPDDRSLLQSGTTELEYRVWSDRDHKYVWLKDIRNADTSDESVVFGALTNISARKEAEAQQLRLQRELAGQKQILSLTLDALVDGVITIDQNGIILSCNPAIYRMFGYQNDELVGQAVQMLMPQTMGQQHQPHVQRYIITGESHVIGRGRDVQGMRKDGVEFPLHISVTELPAEHTEQRVFVGCMHDLTETRKQQQQLLQASKLSALGTLTSGIAHDFNNILGIMRGYAEMLSGQQEQQVRHYAQNIIKAADRGSSLTRSLLDFSSNRARELQQGDINAIVEDLKQLLLEACGKHVELVLNLATEPLPVELEKGGLENALLNMAINARHAMKDGGVLTINTQLCRRSEAELKSMDLHGTDYLEIRVGDTGTGMTDEVRQRLFEPFFTTKGTEGNGLGLAQVFGFIRRAQGNIEVKSELGHGTEFRMLLPLSHKPIVAPVRLATADTTRPSISTPATTADDDSPAILVVDDEPELLDVHVTMLQAAGFVVYSAGSAAAALEVLQQYKIDVLVSDIVMPEMDGLALAKQALATYPNLKVQMVSGFANVELATDEVTSQLFADRLTKPVTSRGLVNRVRLLLC